MWFCRLVFVAAFVWGALVEMAEVFVLWQFGMELDGDWYLLLNGSSFAEICAFARLYALPLSAVILAFSLLVALAWRLAFGTSRRRFALVLILLAGYVGLRAWSLGSIKLWKPLYVAFDTLRSARVYAQIGEAGAWTSERAAKVAALPDGATNYVFVIGESMTSCRLSFYGYEKHTTPVLEALGERLAKLGPIWSPSPYTVLSLPGLFIRDGVSAPVRFRQAGYETFFVGTHQRWERYCSVETAVFAACEHKVYVSEVRKGECLYDEMLLPYVKEMTSGTRPFALFVHIMGSHFYPRERVPENFACAEGLDDYDRSICYTDRVLSEIISLLPPRTVLYYVSDHGESVDCAGWRDLRSKALRTVPVLAYPAEAAVRRIDSVADFTALWYNLPK